MPGCIHEHEKLGQIIWKALVNNQLDAQFVRQVVYLQGSYQDARSTKHKILQCTTSKQTHQYKNIKTKLYRNNAATWYKKVLQNETTNPQLKLNLNSVALVRTRTIPTERPPPVGEVSANFCR